MTMQQAHLPNQRQLHTMQFMARFQCKGGACEDTCCAGWTVLVDERAYRAIKEATKNPKPERERFKKAFQILPPGDSRGQYAKMAMREDTGKCHFLEDGGLCGVHARVGEPALPNVCSVYPRKQGVFGGRVEWTGYISCPESARQLLLAEDACEVVTDHPALSSRFMPVQVVAGKSATPYGVELDNIRGFFGEMLSLPDATLKQKLFLLCLFASRVDGVFHRDTTGDPTETLAHEMQRLRMPAERSQALRFIATQDINLRVPAMIAGEVLRLLGSASNSTRYRDLVQTAFSEYVKRTRAAGGTDADAPDAERSATFDLASLASDYATTMQKLRAACGERLDQYFGNFAKYFTYSIWYTHSRNLTEYLQRMLLERALVQLVMCGHPKLRAALDDLVGEGGLEAGDWDESKRDCLRGVLDRVAVEVVYLTARTYEHGTKMVDQLCERLEAKGLQSLAGLVYLLSF
jgi:lysine-N-methylase